VASPYRGLSPFQEEDTPLFFGREEEIKRSVQRLLTNRFLAIVGPSGIGKTSLIHAGIIPLIREKHPQINPIVNCRFGADPITSLSFAISEFSSNNRATSSTGLLVIDQFEELYTISDETDRQNVLREIYPLVDTDSVALLIALRADFFSRLLESPALSKLFEQSAVLLGPLSPASLRRAIIQPAQIAGLTFEDGVLDRIVSDVGTGVATLPLLQMLLRNLADTNDNGFISLADYQRLGTLQGALEQILERLWYSAAIDDQKKIRAIMLRLVSISADGHATRRAMTLDEVSDNERPMVERLVANRLLVAHHDPKSGQNVIEVVHEAIFSQWPRFSAWLEEEREFLTRRYRISSAVEVWDQANRDSSYLLTGGMLEQAKLLLRDRRSYLSESEVEFIKQSTIASERFSAWKLVAGSLGLTRLQKEAVEREKRRVEIQSELHALSDQLRKLEAQKASLASKLTENKHDVERMSPRVFLSYASEDFSRVKPLYDQLKKQGLQPWLDRENLLPGVDWDKEIIRQIKRSDFVLFCLSTRSTNKRGYVQKELRTALRTLEEIPGGHVYLIPVRLEDCSVPDELAHLQFADAFRDGEFDKILMSIFKGWAESK